MTSARQAEVRVLGGTVSVRRPDGSTEEPVGNMARLLGLLVSHADQPVSVTEIMRAVWPDLDPDLVERQQVERLVSGLRELFGEGARSILPVRKHDHYRLNTGTGPVWVDSVEFDRLTRAAQSSLAAGHFRASQQHAAQAVMLWQSDPVVLPEAWTELKRQHRNALLVAAEAAMRAGDHRRAAVELAAFVEDHPDDEAGRRLLADANRGAAPADARAPSTAQSQPLADARRPHRRIFTAPRAAAAIVLATAALGLAVFEISRGGESRGPTLATVFNLEAECQRPRTRDCRLGLVRDPYASYTPQNVVRYVWHGDVLRVECFVPEGSRVVSEDGRPTTRWYRVIDSHGARSAASGEPAWLPAIRIRRGSEPAVPRCADA